MPENIEVGDFSHALGCVYIRLCMAVWQFVLQMFLMYSLTSCFYFWNAFKYDSCLLEAILKIQLVSSVNVKYTTDTTQQYVMLSLSGLMQFPDKYFL